MRIRIKIKGDTKKHEETLFVPDEYNFSKENKALKASVEKACDESGIEDMQEVKLFADFEW
jgi:hypothetical protein